jgi:pimeloyl-ACP methyl ester carboxylesterase
MADARGHGRSSAPEDGYEPGTMGDDLAVLIRGLSLHRPLVLGHSMGAITALAFAGNHPDLPRAILLEDPPPWWMAGAEWQSAQMQERVQQMRDRITVFKQLGRDELIAGKRVESPDWPEAELDPWADAKLAFDLRALALLRGSVPGSVDWMSVVPRITCPVLLITADTERGAIVSAEHAARLQAMVTQTRVVHIPGAGHNIRREQPTAYMNAVREFISEVTG